MWMESRGGEMKDLHKLQEEVMKWAQYNFPKAQPWEPLVGLMEEVGELSHAHLKKHQKIRLEEDHDANKVDAVGDIVIYLADYCWRNGISLSKAVSSAWEEVKKRDWQKHRLSYTGKEERWNTSI